MYQMGECNENIENLLKIIEKCNKYFKKKNPRRRILYNYYKLMTLFRLKGGVLFVFFLNVIERGDGYCFYLYCVYIYVYIYIYIYQLIEIDNAVQDGLTGSAWGDWANYIASPWAPAGSQQLAVGITDKWGGLCPANDACVIDSFALQWFTSRHLRNRFMHALNGNSCLFAWALAFCIFLSWYFMDPLLALVTLCWSFFWFRRVWHLHTKPRFLKPYRFVGRARHAAARVRHSHAS